MIKGYFIPQSVRSLISNGALYSHVELTWRESWNLLVGLEQGSVRVDAYCTDCRQDTTYVSTPSHPERERETPHDTVLGKIMQQNVSSLPRLLTLACARQHFMNCKS